MENSLILSNKIPSVYHFSIIMCVLLLKIINLSYIFCDGFYLFYFYYIRKWGVEESIKIDFNCYKMLAVLLDQEFWQHLWVLVVLERQPLVCLDGAIEQENSFFKEFKRIHDKIVCLDRIFEKRFNFWYFYESFWLTKTVGFQILSKNKEFKILFRKCSL